MAFGLLSDLDDTLWTQMNEDDIPCDKRKMAGGIYKPWGFVKNSKEENRYRYWLNSNDGSPSEGLLYGVARDPFKQVGHAWMTFEKRKPGNIITGIAIEQDWVTLDSQFVKGLGEPEKEEPKKEQLVRSETIDMGIYGDLTHSKWDRKGKPPRAKGAAGYHFYDILKTTDQGDKVFDISLEDDHSNIVHGKITDVERDPFHCISKGYFKIDKDNVVKGIIIDDQWVEMYE